LFGYGSTAQSYYCGIASRREVKSFIVKVGQTLSGQFVINRYNLFVQANSALHAGGISIRSALSSLPPHLHIHRESWLYKSIPLWVSMETDRELLNAARQMNKDALVKVFDLYSSALYKYAVRICGDRVMADHIEEMCLRNF